MRSQPYTHPHTHAHSQEGHHASNSIWYICLLLFSEIFWACKALPMPCACPQPENEAHQSACGGEHPDRQGTHPAAALSMHALAMGPSSVPMLPHC